MYELGITGGGATSRPVAEARHHALIDLVEEGSCAVAITALVQDVTREARVLARAIVLAQLR